MHVHCKEGFASGDVQVSNTDIRYLYVSLYQQILISNDALTKVLTYPLYMMMVIIRLSYQRFLH